MAKLFIVGFPKTIGEIELVEMFSLHGAVNTVTVVTDKETREPKGYGFVTMNDDISAERAIKALNGLKLGERTLNVRFAEEKPNRQAAPGISFQKPYPRNTAPQSDNRTQTAKPKRPRKPL
jgi:RNA recognition motif-containing protein